MAETKVARRYAKSLLGLGRERNILDALFEDMKLIRNTIKANRELALLLKSPIINTDKKDKILHEIFGSRIDKVTMEFLNIITRKRREYYVEDIVNSYVSIYKDHIGVQSAQAITATPIDEEIKAAMLSIIKQTTDYDIELNSTIDEDIIGGFILRWDDRQVDASVIKKLHDLKQDFKSNLYLKDY